MPFSEAELMMKPSTSDPELIRAILDNTLIAIERIERRFEGINSLDSFVSDDEGIDRLNGITMMLINNGRYLYK